MTRRIHLTASPAAVHLSSEYLRLFTREAIHRAAEVANLERDNDKGAIGPALIEVRVDTRVTAEPILLLKHDDAASGAPPRKGRCWFGTRFLSMTTLHCTTRPDYTMLCNKQPQDGPTSQPCNLHGFPNRKPRGVHLYPRDRTSALLLVNARDHADQQ